MNKIEVELKGKCGIYIITNIFNGNRYIGSSLNLYDRLHSHLSLLTNDKHTNSHLQNAWNKYGKENFIFGILKYSKDEEVLNDEQLFIDIINPEYNIEKDISIIDKHRTEETKLKIKEGVQRAYKEGRSNQTKNLKQVYIYNIENLHLIKTCKTIRDASEVFYNRRNSLKNENIDSLVIHDLYVASYTKFTYEYELKNYIYELHFKYKGFGKDIRYLILNDGEQIFFILEIFQVCLIKSNVVLKQLLKNIVINTI